MNSNPHTIEQQARELFKHEAGRALLLDTWANLPENERPDYPELAFACARVCIAEGKHMEARAMLDTARINLSNPARIYLMEAQMSFEQGDYEQTESYLKNVREQTDEEALLAEAEFLQGELLKTNAPQQALDHFKKSQMLYLRLRDREANFNFEVARASFRAAETSFKQNMRTAGWLYQRQAEASARQADSPDLLAAVLLNGAIAYEQEGNYKEAILACDVAFTLSTIPAQQAQIRRHRARLAIASYDDTTARELLLIPVESEQRHTQAYQLLSEAWLLALNYALPRANDLIGEAQALMGDNLFIRHESYILQGLIAAQQGKSDASVRQLVGKAITFFHERRMYVEASQARLILSWLHAIFADLAQVQALVREIERDVSLLGHVNHLVRLYDASHALLGYHWQPQLTRSFQLTLKKFHRSGIRVFGFGTPHAYIGDREIQYRNHYGRVNIKMLLWLLEKKDTTLQEITSALWENDEPAVTQKRFHTNKSHLSDTLGRTDWYTYDQDTLLYTLNDGLVNYYDGYDYRNTYDHLLDADNELQALLMAHRVVSMYQPFAKGVEGDAFDELRTYYTACHDNSVEKALEILPVCKPLLPPQWSQQLNHQFKTALLIS